MKNALKIKRWQAGLKQYELAYLMGCSSTYLSLVENNRIEPTNSFKLKASEIFNTHMDELFPRSEQVRRILANLDEAILN